MVISREKRGEFKARAVNCLDSKKQFATSSCVLPISLGQHYHQDDRLEAILQFINTHFQSCHVVIADLLQRHNLMMTENLTEDNASNYLLAQSDRWLERHTPLFEELSIPLKVYRWADWFDSADYRRQRDLTEQAFHEDIVVHSAIMKTSRQFTDKLMRRYPELSKDKERIEWHCHNYVMEECAVMPLWVREKWNFEVYPAKRLPAMIAIYEKFVKPFYPDRLRWVRLEIRRRAKAKA
ncbi:MAG: tRNA-dependent cyclodipeptide synthase [Legionellales bacterium]|nr:tRNA-dependent cyclodipeptide synthase [Legionellales bacterium]